MSLYAVADIHSYYTPLEVALTDAGFFNDRDARLILLGDALDRGKETKKVERFLTELKREGRLIYIRGNHEDLFSDCLSQIERGGIFEIASGMSHHYSNGTFDSMLDLLGTSAREAVENTEEFLHRIKDTDFYKELLPSCIDYYETDSHIFCHGWLPTVIKGYRPNAECLYYENWRNAPRKDWERARWYNGMELALAYNVKEPNKTVVCGHWHTSFGHYHYGGAAAEWGVGANFSPFFADGIIALDACTAKTGIVNVMVFED